jgi:hypothetical protein
MAAKKKAAGAARAAKENPYVQRLIDDEDLRDNIYQAYEAARDAYSRLSDGKSPTKAIFDDKKLQKDLRQAADSIREASFALREAPKRSKPRRKGGMGRTLMLALVAGGLAMALSEDLRKKVLDALFGAEEEFEYTSTTTATTGTAGSTTSPPSTTAST